MKYGYPMVIPVICERILWRLLHCYDVLKSKIICWLWGVGPGRLILFQGRTFLRVHHKGDVIVGDKVVFNARYSMNPVGLTNATLIDTRPGGKIKIGSNCGFSSVVISSRSHIDIGNNVLVGGNVRIFDHDFHAVDWHDRREPENRAAIRTKPIVIGDDCFIGTNAIILKGSRLGARSIVAAGSVVLGLDVPPDSMVKGNPAVIVSRHM